MHNRDRSAVRILPSYVYGIHFTYDHSPPLRWVTMVIWWIQTQYVPGPFLLFIYGPEYEDMVTWLRLHNAMGEFHQQVLWSYGRRYQNFQTNGMAFLVILYIPRTTSELNVATKGSQGKATVTPTLSNDQFLKDVLLSIYECCENKSGHIQAFLIFYNTFM